MNNPGKAQPSAYLIDGMTAAHKAGVKFSTVLELIRQTVILSCVHDAKHWVSPAAVDVLREHKEKIKHAGGKQ